jgi:hypothetical protein
MKGYGFGVDCWMCRQVEVQLAPFSGPVSRLLDITDSGTSRATAV